MPNEASKAAKYLNISLHQSQLVISPGFVIVRQESGVISVTSFSVDGKSATVARPAFADPMERHRLRVAQNDGRHGMTRGWAQHAIATWRYEFATYK